MVLDSQLTTKLLHDTQL